MLRNPWATSSEAKPRTRPTANLVTVQKAKADQKAAPSRINTFWRYYARALERLSRLGATGARQRVSGRRDAAGHLSESVCDADRRQDGGHGLLGAAYGRRSIPGFCNQLHAPGLSGSLVPSIWFVHVSVPRRSVLPRRLARLGTAGARPCRISVESSEGSDHHSRRSAAHTGSAYCRCRQKDT